MKKKRREHLTVEQFMAELAADPDYQRRMAEKKERTASRHREMERVAQPLLEELRGLGYLVESVPELVQKYAPLAPEAVQVLVKWAPEITSPNVQEMVVRAIGAARESYDGRPLVRLFEASGDFSVRWAIANTFAMSTPGGIEDWISGALQNSKYGDARQMLCLAAARMLDPGEARALLRGAFDDVPLHAADALGQIGGRDDLAFLQSRMDVVDKNVQREVMRAIERIKRSLARD